MRNFRDTFETRKRSFISTFSICMTVPLILVLTFLQFLTEQSLFRINPSRPNPGQRQKINLNFYFQTSLWCRKRFYEGLKV